MNSGYPTYPNPTFTEAVCDMHFRLPQETSGSLLSLVNSSNIYNWSKCRVPLLHHTDFYSYRRWHGWHLKNHSWYRKVNSQDVKFVKAVSNL